MPDPIKKSPWPYRLQLILHRKDQISAAILWILCAAGMLLFFGLRVYTHGRLIEIDDAERQQVMFMVDINAASWPELANLPGIGERLAKTIVEHREKFGPFASHDQLTDVAGIGKVKLKNLRRHLAPLNSSRK